MQTVAAAGSMENLRQHVLEILCAHDRLDPLSTPLEQTILVRRGKPCGLLFQVVGPRMLRAHAIWAASEHRVLFYDSTGDRFAETRLSESPDLRKLPA
jgi:hypothetical protein